MRSRTARWSVCAIAVIALAASAFIIFRSEQQLAPRRDALRRFDATARDAAASLGEMRAAEQAYVAAGQGVGFWMPKVAALVDAAQSDVDSLRTLAAASAARAPLMEAGATITEFSNVDKRTRDYIKAGQPLMAADVVFTEAGDTASSAAEHLETATVAEHAAFDAFELRERKAELYALAGAGLLGFLTLVLLAGVGPAEAVESDAGLTTLTGRAARSALAASSGADSSDWAAQELPRTSAPALKTAAELCTEFGRVRDADDLTRLLARTADALEATGLVVWLGTGPGGNLCPAIAHGYPPQTLARMPSIPRSADNAAAAAYRTGSLQIVLARPGVSGGALVAPLLSPDGCIGALTAEIKGGAETSDTVQSLAAIFAAQLAGVLGSTVAAGVEADTARAANS
jgi:hypothetical protein